MSAALGVSVTPNACVSCYTKKRKCDRQLLGCSRCASTGSRCSYQSSSDKVSRGVPSEAIDPSARHGSWRAEIPSRIQFSTTQQDRDSLILSCAHSTLARTGAPRPESLSTDYWDSVHWWLPIIDPRRLGQAVAKYANDVSSAVTVLFLHIFLLNSQPKVSHVGMEEPYQTLYSTCKSLFTLQCEIQDSPITTIQSGILLAVFEIGRGFLSDAYNTLTVCATLWHHRFDSDPTPTAGGLPQWDEMHLLWCAIYTLDRLHCSFSEPQRPFIIEQLRNLDTYNAVLTDREEQSSIGQLTAPHGIERQYQRRIVYFTRQAQAWHALDKILLLENPAWADVLTWDSWLQTQLSEVFQTNEDDWVLPYSPTVVLLLALIELHIKSIMSFSASGNENGSARASSLLAIDTAINVTRDIVGMDDINNIRKMPLAAVLLLQRAIAATSMLISECKTDIGVLQDLAGSLQRAKFQWNIAGSDFLGLAVE
ncbi:unnamed protein product [Clonostachys rosea]|uniref:Zn(2)-C6 fungal-type domain-containing protein n=1 Tax=Bionectria ochroleuca TaxID=29856 RepID=A0ABY6U8C6_BIOOC|nr:unnamed protein product [Clonostachys rosea]